MASSIKMAGLLTGNNWQTIVDQLMTIESVPITRLQTEQSTNSNKSDALAALKTKLTALQSSATALNSSDLYGERKISSGASGSTWTLSASSNATAGSYTVNVSTLATASQLAGTSNIGSSLSDSNNVSSLTLATMPTATAIKAGTFTVNGATVTIATTDTLQNVFDKISTATSGAVTASYSSSSDTISLNSSSSITIGAANDTSNFLAAMKLTNASNATTLTSSGTLGTVSTSTALGSDRFNTTLTTGTGSFSINGVSISYDTSSDTLKSIISKINSSSAGVTASYDSVNDRMLLTNTSTGNLGVSTSDTTGNLLQTLGITGGTLTQGSNAVFTVNGGAQQTSYSNVFSDEQLGTSGISITANTTGSQTITVANDATSATSAINNFISAFNAVQDYVTSATAISNTNGKVTTSVLSDNHEIQDWASKLRSLAFNALSSYSGSVKRLEDMGIDFNSGTNDLAVQDSTKLAAALNSSTSGVADFFSNSSTGFSQRMLTYMTNILGDGVSKGLLDTSTDNITKQNSSLDDQIAAIQRRLDQQRSSMESEFQAMESYQTKANSIMTQLSKSFFS